MEEKKQTTAEELEILTRRIADIERILAIMEVVASMIHDQEAKVGGIVKKNNLSPDAPVMKNMRESLVNEGMTFEDADEAILGFIQSIKDGKPWNYIETPKGRMKMEVRGI